MPCAPPVTIATRSFSLGAIVADYMRGARAHRGAEN